MVCVFKHLYCSAQLSMSNMEKRYRNKIIIIIIIIKTSREMDMCLGREQLSWQSVGLAVLCDAAAPFEPPLSCRKAFSFPWS